MTNTLTFSSDGKVKGEIPHTLYMQIIKVQSLYNLSWMDASIKVAQLLDIEGFRKEVKLEAERIYGSRFMTALNKAKNTISENIRIEVINELKNREDYFRLVCHKCGRFMFFSSKDENWSKVKAILQEAFSNWSHANC